MIKSVPLTVRFRYRSEKGEETRREVEPYELKPDGGSGSMTLFGWCLQRQAMRKFKLANMSDVQHGQRFVPNRRDEKNRPINVVVPC